MISVVQKFTFIGLTGSKVLDLSHNKINSLNTKSFYGLINVIFLKINQNPLKSLHIHLLQELYQRKFIIQIILGCAVLNQDQILYAIQL